MKIVFIGSVNFSEHCLKKLIDMSANIVGICTLKDSKFNSDFVDLSMLGHSNKIPVKYTPNINSSISIQWISDLKPDIIFCFGWSRLIGQQLLKVAPMGILGYHPAELPKNRGRHPLIWALALGLDKSASTFFFMDEGADSGDILSQKYFKISKKDDAGLLYEKVINIAKLQIEEFLPNLISNNYTLTPQNDKESNYWRKRNFMDGQIDWRMSAESIYNLVRSLTKPYVGAHITFDGQEIKIWKVKIVKNSIKNIEPGKVLKIKKNIITVKAGEDSICIIESSNIDPLRIGDYL